MRELAERDQQAAREGTKSQAKPHELHDVLGRQQVANEQPARREQERADPNIKPCDHPEIHGHRDVVGNGAKQVNNSDRPRRQDDGLVTRRHFDNGVTGAHRVAASPAKPGVAELSHRRPEQPANPRCRARRVAQARPGAASRYAVPDYVAAAAFVAAVAEVAEADMHHPNIKLTYSTIDVSLCTHEDGRWVTEKDINMARKISQIAHEKGLAPEPGSVTQLEIARRRSRGPVAVLVSAAHRYPGNKIYGSIFDPTDRVQPYGSRPPTTTKFHASAGTLTCGSLPRPSTKGSLQRWPPEGRWSTTPEPQPSRFSPTQTATGSASVARRDAEPS